LHIEIATAQAAASSISPARGTCVSTLSNCLIACDFDERVFAIDYMQALKPCPVKILSYRQLQDEWSTVL